MLLSNAMRTPRAVERSTISWDEMMAGARSVSLGSGDTAWDSRARSA